ncbi:translation initiation factor IF-2, mitochondrial-like [Daphnia pulicaria]|uniref:translation initiation factor IF-2, mitochondrial-like n=1 Tax=Daphnia pulicaria TaxID=35523 RepID=UPI001EEACDC0|nr:translation initiation factor IF-2, mitochondrial-like [Daphnia pulicaria]
MATSTGSSKISRIYRLSRILLVKRAIFPLHRDNVSIYGSRTKPLENTGYFSRYSFIRTNILDPNRSVIPVNHSCNFSTTAICLKQRRTNDDKKKGLAPQSLKTIKMLNKAEMKMIKIWKNMSVLQLASAMDKDLDHIFEVMIYVDNSADYDQPWKCIDNIKVIQEIVKKSGMRCTITAEPTIETHNKEIKDAVRRPPAKTSDCVPRHPVVTIMGHVDHGKTTLLDSLRHTRVVDGEFGGITQHIGAFEVCLDNGEMITFLDTPGHAAFTAMRSRGAHVTDIVVLVVAADDGVMEQTRESIRLANEAKVPIIVAINKVDKREADIARTKNMLMAQGLVLEEAGGDVQTVAVSALKGTGLQELIETINTQATLLDLKADPKGLVEATVIESRTDPFRGKLSTAIIQRGTLRKGSILVAGTAWAKVRSMFDDQGKPIQQAPPSTPVEIVGWKDLPSAGDEIFEVETERRAHEVISFRQSLKSKEKLDDDLVVIQQKVEEHLKDYKVKLGEKQRMGKMRYKIRGIRPRATKEISAGPKLSIIIKGDVDGSVEALLDVLDSYQSEKCTLDLIHYGVGPITESDIKLAEPFNAIVYAFNTGVAQPNVRQLAKLQKVQIKDYNIIYRLFDDLRSEMEKLLPPTEAEEIIGEANVLQEFIVTEGRHKLPVAGCRCVKGMLKKAAFFRLIRGEDSIYEGRAASIKHLKNEVDTIKKDVECGIRLDDASLQFRPGDKLVCYEMKEVPQTIDWDPGF